MRRSLLALLLLAGCQAPTPAPSLGARAPAAPRAVAPAAPVDGAWTFAASATACTARVTHADATLSVTAGPERRIAFALRGGAQGASRASRIAFAGAEGGWTLRGAPAADGIRATLPLNAANEARVQQLLGGGTASLPGTRLPPLRVPDAGVSGREWFGCLARLPRGGDEARLPRGGDDSRLPRGGDDSRLPRG